MSEDRELLNRLCQKTKKADVLNAFHACRPGHPLGSKDQWRNAYALAKQQPSNVFDAWDIIFLEKKAATEAGADRWFTGEKIEIR